jgi:glycosyltransferase involved in cell wall biosynthesis
MAATDSISIHNQFPGAVEDRLQPLTILVLFPSQLLTDNRPHGDGRLAWGYIRALAERGHTLHVAARNVDFSEPLPPNVFVYPLSCSRSSETLLERLRFMRSVRSLIRKLHTNFDLVHELNPVYRGVSLSLLDQHVPLVLGPFPPAWPSDSGATLDVGITRYFPAPLKRRVAELQQSRASALLLMTPAAIDRVARPGGGRIFELPPGLDIDFFQPHPELYDGKPSILFLANLNRRKGIFTLLEAFVLVREQIPEARLTVAGGGTEYAIVSKQIADMGLSSSVEIVGEVPRSSVPALMAKHSAYCLPSYGEPFATSVLEAMACGRPVVITNAGGLPSVVSEQGGRLATPRDPQTLASALVEILGSRTLQDSMGQHNRNVMVERFSWSRVADRLEHIYQTVLQEKRSKVIH